jgi:2-dehydro-3-deoxyphosphogluconate aldolase / (4S)-4-hydroxy-2-oxoglutarate aldolase
MADRRVTDGHAADTLAAIGRSGLVAIVRTPSTDGVADACRVLFAADVPCVEITLTVPGALDVVTELAGLSEDSVIGVGTVLDVGDCRRAIEAGATFVVAPGFDPEVVAYARSQGVVAVPGALTPTEVMHCLRAGADLVKLFPARIATVDYLKDLAGPLPHARFMPTGSIDADGVTRYLSAGAFAVGVGSALVSPRAVSQHDFGAIAAAADAMRRAVAAAKRASA